MFTRIIMKIENANWFLDYARTTDDYKNFILKHFIKDYIFQHRLRYMIYFRKCQNTNNNFFKLFYKFKLYMLCRKYGIEIKPQTQIGEGFLMVHPYNITIAPKAVLGRNVTMLKGSTIGKSEGKKPGVPIIGNDVFIGLNSTVLGGIVIGDDVLIGPNTVVNKDIPSHSVVIGNPCIIIHRENATKDYLNYKI